MKWIQIWYSWGDKEPPIAVKGTEKPCHENKALAWEKMKELAFKEAEIAFEEHEDYGPVGLQFYKKQGCIVLHYPYDGEKCYYQITDTKQFEPEE